MGECYILYEVGEAKLKMCAGANERLKQNYAVKRALGQAFRERLAEFEAEPSITKEQTKMHSEI